MEKNKNNDGIDMENSPSKSSLECVFSFVRYNVIDIILGCIDDIVTNLPLVKVHTQSSHEVRFNGIPYPLNKLDKVEIDLSEADADEQYKIIGTTTLKMTNLVHRSHNDVYVKVRKIEWSIEIEKDNYKIYIGKLVISKLAYDLICEDEKISIKQEIGKIINVS